MSRRSRFYYEPFWTGLWIEHAMSFFQRRALPYYVAEIGTIGGLHAVADLLAPVAGFDSGQIAGRVAFAQSPLRLESPADRAWLLGACLPDAPGPFKAVEADIARYRALIEARSGPVEIIDCDALTSVQALAANIRPHRQAGLLVLTTWITRRMAGEEFARFRGEMETLFKPWGDRALWIELIAAPGGRPGIDYRVGAYRLGKAGLVGQPLARIELGQAQPSVLADSGANRAFLS